MSTIIRDFEQDWRRQQERRGQPLADDLYWQKLKADAIKRFEMSDGERLVLDTKLAVDCIVTLPTGQLLTVQEKFLGYKFSRYNSLTFEYYQDWQTGEDGDWFKCLADLLLVAYFNEAEDAFDKWAIISAAWLKLATVFGYVTWQTRQNKEDGARASFKWVDVATLPMKQCIIFQQGFIR
jgi:hypothetical protein